MYFLCEGKGEELSFGEVGGGYQRIERRSSWVRDLKYVAEAWFIYGCEDISYRSNGVLEDFDSCQSRMSSGNYV